MTERYVAPTSHLANRLRQAAQDQTNRYANAQQIADYEYEQMTRIERAITLLEPVQLPATTEKELESDMATIAQRFKPM